MMLELVVVLGIYLLLACAVCSFVVGALERRRCDGCDLFFDLAEVEEVEWLGQEVLFCYLCLLEFAANEEV